MLLGFTLPLGSYYSTCIFYLKIEPEILIHLILVKYEPRMIFIGLNNFQT